MLHLASLLLWLNSTVTRPKRVVFSAFPENGDQPNNAAFRGMPKSEVSNTSNDGNKKWDIHTV